MNQVSTLDAVLSKLKSEFITTTMDRLEALEEVIETYRTGGGGGADTLAEVRRQAHSIKGSGGTMGLPVVSSIAHRLEDYLSGLTTLTERHIIDTYHFIDTLRDVVASGGGLEEAATNEILRSLPAKWFPAVDVKPGSVEVLVGIESPVLRRVVERELCLLAYRVISADSAMDVLQLGITMRPNAIVVTAVMKDLWGLDVARALGSMDATAHIPVGLLTSLEDRKLTRLPANAIIIQKHADGLAEGLARLAAAIKVS